MEKKLQQAGLRHVRLVQGDARSILWLLCASATISGLYVNFPDPWPKASHQHRRLINEQFLHLAAVRMKPGALLAIATDHAEYAEVITEHLGWTPYFDSLLPTPFINEAEERPRTKYEMKALIEGRPCYYFQWHRNNVLAPDNFPLPKELPMPHVVLRTPLRPPDLIRQFKPDRVSADSIHVNLIELYQSPANGNLLIEAYIKEESLTQRIGLTIHWRVSGDLVIGLHEIGFPRPTPGIQLAIHHLTQWVLSLQPQGQIVHTNLGDTVHATRPGTIS
jgi:tRNA (guanine-N7-)-methyltransferase